MKTKLYVVTIIIAVVASLFSVVYAADSKFTASLKSSNSSVETGKEFTVTLTVQNIGESIIEKGINSIEGKLKYDTEAFEAISEDSIEGVNDWAVDYDEDKESFKLTNLKFANKSQEVCKITFKTKSSTSATKGTIEISDLVAANSDKEIKADDISTSVNIGASSIRNTNSIRIDNNNTNTDENTNTNNNTNTNENTRVIGNLNTNTNNNNTNNTNNTNSNNVNKNETKEDKMPKTGIDDSIVKAIILVAFVGIFGYIKVKSLDKK